MESGYDYLRKKQGEGEIKSDYVNIKRRKYLETVFVFRNDGKTYMARSLTSTTGPGNNVIFDMIYLERLTGDKSENSRISDWSPDSKKDGSQNKLITDFLDRCKANLEIIIS
jgi:hypothetical protein